VRLKQFKHKTSPGGNSQSCRDPVHIRTIKAVMGRGFIVKQKIIVMGELFVINGNIYLKKIVA